MFPSMDRSDHAMKNKRLLLLGLTFVLLVIAAFVVMEMPGERSALPDARNALVKIDSATISKVEIVAPSHRVMLAKHGSEWRVEAPLTDRADQVSVASFIGEIGALRSRSVVSTNPQKQGLFHVDSTGTVVTVSGAETPPVAIVIGKMGASYAETYVRLMESDEVHLVSASLTFVGTRGVNGWRDKAIMKVPQEEIRSVTYHYGDTTFTLEFQDSLWVVGGKPADDALVRALLASLADVQADEFVEPAPSPVPPVSAAVTYAGNELRFSAGRTSDVYTVERSTDHRWFEMKSWRVQQILKREAELRAKRGE